MVRFFLAAFAALPGLASAQVFSVLPGPPAPVAGNFAVPGPRPAHGAIVGTDNAALHVILAGAPAERLGDALDAYGLALDLPNPDGGFTACHLARSMMMEPGLAAKFPQMETFSVDADDHSAGGRLELTPRGLTGMLRTIDGTAWMIDLYQSGDPAHLIVYRLRDLPNSNDWTCHTAGAAPVEDDGAGSYAPRVLQTRRAFRAAIACTGEWGLHQCDVQGHAPNIADPLAAIVTVVSRANVIYERDFGIHFDLVANEDQVVFIDPATDPYPDACDGGGGMDCSGDYLVANPTAVTQRIGSSNYDIGHVLTRVYGGVASLACVCAGNKAAGSSGVPRGGDIDPLTALVMIHEMGHQFSANHSFSGARGRCAGNINLAAAVEAGSGSSPMGYPGGCPVGSAPPSDNVAVFADPFFHHSSYLEVTSFAASTTCPVQTTTSNSTPVLTSMTANANIPPGTPFRLAAAATDADAGDVLTYSWEQRDSGVSRPLSGPGSEDNGFGALFRIFSPVTSGARTFLQMADILSGIPTPGERLPAVTNRTMHFRVIVRDNHTGAGGVALSPIVTITVPPGTSPFAITSPAAHALARSGAYTVTWSVGGTSAAPIAAATVVVSLSLDDGGSFSSLGTFPNTGSATISLPAAPAAGYGAARLKLEPVGRIFFAVSQPFTIRPPCTADFNGDGDIGTDQDIEAFFRCLAGNCCAACPPDADFNGDGDAGTDGDIEAFFRTLAGGAC